MDIIKEFKNEYRWLSNFYPCDIEYKDIVYPSIEHFYVAMKTTDPDLRKEISLIETPGKVKRFGRKLDIRENWEDIKISIMEHALKTKFNNPKFKKLLLDTEDDKIIEGNLWHDNFWGSCYCDKCGDKGKNILGKLIMKIRKSFT